MATDTKKDVKTAVEKTPEAPAKKPRKPREKVRPIDEIYDLPVNKLSDKEKESLIKYMKENITLLRNQACEYKQNAEGAFERARNTEQRYKAMEKFYIDSFIEVNIQLKAFSKAVEKITGGVQ